MDPKLFLILMFLTLGMSAVAVGAALFFYQRYSNPEPTLIQQRLIQLKTRQEEEVSQEEKEKAEKLARMYKDADYQNEKLGQKLEELAFFRYLKLTMQQAGMKTTADKFFIVYMVMPVVLGVVLGVALGFLVLAFFGAAVAGVSYLVVLWKKKKRLNKFVTQLPDALSLITTALRAGHSFQSALSVVSTELPDPISTEFAASVRDINLGIPVKEALNRMVARLDTLPDVRMFATAVMIQREAGGNLAEVLEKLGYTIRERFKLKGQISALTGQSRLTGYVLGAAPAVILTGLSIFLYSYVAPLWETDLGHVALVVAVILQLIGFVIIRRIINIRV